MSASETPSVRLPVRLLEAARALGCKLLDTAAGLHSFHGATKAQWWGIDTVRAYQDTMLRLVVEHAYRTVPYYRDLDACCRSWACGYPLRAGPSPPARHDQAWVARRRL